MCNRPVAGWMDGESAGDETRVTRLQQSSCPTGSMYQWRYGLIEEGGRKEGCHRQEMINMWRMSIHIQCCARIRQEWAGWRCLRNVMRRVGSLSANTDRHPIDRGVNWPPDHQPAHRRGWGRKVGRAEIEARENRDKQIDQITRHGSFPISYWSWISSGVGGSACPMYT